MLLSRAISSASRTAALNLVKAPPSSASALPFLAALTVSLSACSIHSTSGDIARADGGEPALSGKEFRSFPVISNSKLTHDTHQIKVALPPSTTLGMTVASCLTIRANIDGNVVARPYTPVSTKDQKDYAEFIIKAYPPRTDDKPGGMGRHLINLKEGDAIEMKGPWSKHQYVPNSFNKVIMIAGGTGITPCLQVITEILSNSNDKTDVVLIYANKTEGDIIVREMLDDLSRKHQNFSLLYTLEKPPEKWAGEVGYVDESMIRKANSLGNQAQGGDITFVCGPPPMMESVCGAKGPKGSQGEVGGILKKMGCNETNVYKF